MIIDLRTLSLVTGIIFSLMAIALILQYSLNKNYCGIGWWASGCTTLAAGCLILHSRDIVTIEKISIFTANILLLSGLILMYIGTMRFMNKKENLRIIISVFTLFIFSTFFIIYIKRDNNIRVIILYIASSIIIFFIIHILIVNKISSIRISSGFTAIVFIIYGLFLIFRSAVILTTGHIVSVFTPDYLQIAAFMITLSAGVLWTFGFIIMVNQRLNAELRGEKESFELIFNSSPAATLINRFDDRLIVNINEAFSVITGFSSGETIGKTTNDLKLWADSEDYRRIVDEIEQNNFCNNYETVFRIKNGNLLNGIISAKIIELDCAKHILSITHDITERKNSEKKIKTLLEEKELILREVHHRIKNNMNSIRGLLFLQSETLTEQPAIDAINEAESRIASMMVLYDKLYRSDSFNELPIEEYLSGLVEEIISSFPNKDIVKVETYIDDFTINSETLFPLGIIVNEIITNIMKYAFTGKTEGTITLIASSSEQGTTLVIGDNGKGMPDEIDFDNPSRFGLHLIKTLVKQINGIVRIETVEGTRFIIDF